MINNLGQFAVTLTVTDNDGATSSTQLTIDVHAQAAGFYLGRFFSNVTGIDTDVEVHIGTNHQFYGVGFGICFSFYSGRPEHSRQLRNKFAVGRKFGRRMHISRRKLHWQRRRSGNHRGTIHDHWHLCWSWRRRYDSNRLHSLRGFGSPSWLSEIAGVWSWSDGLCSYTETMVIEDTGDFHRYALTAAY